VKKQNKAQIFISLSVLCCFVLGLFHSGNLLPAGAWDNAKAQTQTANVSLAKANLFSPVSQDENIVNGFASHILVFHKSQYKTFLNCVNPFGLALSNCLANYLAWINQNPHKLSSFNIIYPFHYFW
jgi:hypothetical protein